MDILNTNVNFNNLDVSIGSNTRRAEVFELFLDIVVDGDQMHLNCTYNNDLFDSTTITRWMELYQCLLNAVISNVEFKIEKLPVLSVPDRRKLLQEWNQTAMDYPSQLCIQDLISEQTVHFADKIAVQSEEGLFPYEALTYRELDKRSNQLAHHLVKLGVRPGKRVAICLHRRAGLMVALLGVLKAGAAYVPLEPDYPADRLAFMLEDSTPDVLIVDTDLISNLLKDQKPPYHIPIVQLDKERFGENSTERPDIEISPDNIAYVIYTSGSTGKPKGVLISHSAVVNFLKSMLISPGLKHDDKLLAITTLSFDIAVLELYLPLVAGGTVIVASQEDAAEGEKILALIEKYSVSCLQATPATWRMLLDSGWTQPYALKALCGGEALTKDLSSVLYRQCTELWNMYGPTETTVWSSVYKISGIDAEVLIGRPIHNTQFYVLDRNLQLTAIGVPGELYISGHGIAEGYLNRPELTSERFIDNPFSTIQGSKLYRTGDAVRYRPDGAIEYFGRMDTQLKIRGFRIELGEIETVLSSHGEVNQCVVIAKAFAIDDIRLIAYYLSASKTEINNGQLREFLQKVLPGYMIPQYFERLQSLPLTPAGKINRNDLPLPNLQYSPKDYEQPISDIERRLAAIWSQLLVVENPGLGDNFFDLGGHSLLAVKLSGQVRKVFGVNLNLRMLFSNTDLRNQALLIEGLSIDDTADGGDERENFVL